MADNRLQDNRGENNKRWSCDKKGQVIIQSGDKGQVTDQVTEGYVM